MVFVRKNTTLASTLAALLLPAILLADESGEIVILNYVGQPGVTANVDFLGETTKIINGEENVAMTMRGSYVLQTSAHPDGILVSQLQNDVDIDADFGEFTDHMKPLLEAISSLDIKSIISNEGELLKLEGLEQFASTASTSFANIIDSSPVEIKPMMNSMVENALSEESMFQRIQESLALQLTLWIDQEFEKGYVYEIEYVEAVPALGNMELGFDGVYEYLGKVPCNEYDQTASCVELSFQTSMKPEYAESLTKSMAERMNIPLPDDFLIAVDMSALLTSEPSTLKLHRFDKVERIGTPSESGTGWMERIERTSSVYNYINP